MDKYIPYNFNDRFCYIYAFGFKAKKNENWI